MDSTSIFIEPSELRTALAQGALLIDAREPGEFKKGHIPRAVPFSTYNDFVPDTSLEGMKAFARGKLQRFSSAGAKDGRRIIVYDEETGARAARELWILEYLGHQKAQMLHGGLKQWVAEGGAVDFDIEIPTVRPQNLNLIASTGCLTNADEVARRAGSWNFSLLDVRDSNEWKGIDSTACCQRRGHIPGAVHIEWTEFLEHGRFKPPEAIIKLLDEHGVNPLNDIVTYSHSGGRAANTYFALRYAGCAGARNFIGSWHEWSSRSDLPVES